MVPNCDRAGRQRVGSHAHGKDDTVRCDNRRQVPQTAGIRFGRDDPGAFPIGRISLMTRGFGLFLMDCALLTLGTSGQI